MRSSYKVGDLAAKYETPNKGPGYISNGSQWGDPGGDSYGSYQIETQKGTMSEYIKTNDKYARQLAPYKINSKDFKDKWVELANLDPTGFQQSQFDFLANKRNGYYNCLAYAEKIGARVDNFAIQSALFSTSNQSGGWRKILDMADLKPGQDVVVQINKIYDARAEYFKSLKLSPMIKRNIIKNRTVQERRDCLKLV